MSQSVLWHALDSETVLKKLGSTHRGLSTEKVGALRATYGRNELPKEKPLAWWILFFRQFGSPMIYVLVVAAIITTFLKEWTNTGIIAGAIFLNTLIGFLQELKANRALDHLRVLMQPKAMIRREGKEIQVLASELVPGDLLVLQSGDRITADGRLVTSVDLVVNEAILTGESQPIRKQTEQMKEKITLAERTNMVYAGTLVVGGKAEVIVVETGINTQIGQIAKLVSESKERTTPLQQQLTKLAKQLAILISILILALFAAGPWLGYDVLEMLKIAVALAVAAVPEGLVISVTIILAIGMHRILLRRSLVRRLVSAETLGSVSVICSDKTGTLTEGEMRATHILTPDMELEFSGRHTAPKHKTLNRLFESIALCNNAYIIDQAQKLELRGTPTDRALLQFVLDLGMNPREFTEHKPRFAEIPFDSEFKYLSTAHRSGHQAMQILAGAPDRLIKFCTSIEIGGIKKSLTPQRKTALLEQISTWSDTGMRLVGFAQKSLPASTSTLTREGLDAFTWMGLVGLSDPVRSQAKEQILAAQAAGVRTILATGDHQNTARAIAGQVGLPIHDGAVVTGDELDQWSEEVFAQRLGQISVFARVEPRHKIRIIHAWQQKGEVVAMVGDGVNDTPALKAADIGVAVGSGTEAAKHAADLVLLDNDLGTITAAIEQGRVIFDNIRKTTVYLISGSFTEILLIAGSMVLGLPLPLLPAQILWINLVADTFPNIGLTLEPAEKDIMNLRPRPRTEAVLNPDMLRFICIIGTIVITGLFAFYFFLLAQGESAIRMQTFMFAAVGLDTLIYVFSIKSLRHSCFRINPFSNRALLLSVLVSFCLMLTALLLPFFQTVFHVSPLSLSDWLLLLMIGGVKFILIELAKEVLIFRGPFNQKFL